MTAPDTQALDRQEEPKAQELVKIAYQAIVKTDEQYVAAMTFRKSTNAYIKHLEVMEKSATGPILQGLETVRGWFRPSRNAATLAKVTIDPKINAFEQAREKARLDQEARLREQARKQEQKLLDDAKKLEDKGKPVQAAAAREAAESIVTPAVIDTLPKVEGTYHREEWDIEIVDAKLIPEEYKVIDESKIKKLVKAMDGQIEIPGVRNFKRRIQASRKA